MVDYRGRCIHRVHPCTCAAAIACWSVIGNMFYMYLCTTCCVNMCSLVGKLMVISTDYQFSWPDIHGPSVYGAQFFWLFLSRYVAGGLQFTAMPFVFWYKILQLPPTSGLK